LQAPVKQAPPLRKAETTSAISTRQNLDWAQTKASRRFTPQHAAEWLTERTVLMALSTEQARTVAELMQPLTLTAGCIHPQAGQPVVAASELLLILRGTITVELAQDSSDGEPVALPSLLAGDFWGESAFLDATDLPRKVIAHAQGDITAASLSRDALRKLAEDEPETAARFMATVCQSLSQMVRDGHRRVAQASQAMRDAQADS
jgi:CRP-like cAMP-binding protein